MLSAVEVDREKDVPTCHSHSFITQLGSGDGREGEERRDKINSVAAICNDILMTLNDGMRHDGSKSTE